tara:strand:+ start:8977 stop:9504 length:528 start_codon:yes stop_codon:yes gene_type:complete
MDKIKIEGDINEAVDSLLKINVPEPQDEVLVEKIEEMTIFEIKAKQVLLKLMYLEMLSKAKYLFEDFEFIPYPYRWSLYQEFISKIYTSSKERYKAFDIEKYKEFIEVDVKMKKSKKNKNPVEEEDDDKMRLGFSFGFEEDNEGYMKIDYDGDIINDNNKEDENKDENKKNYKTV